MELVPGIAGYEAVVSQPAAASAEAAGNIAPTETETNSTNEIPIRISAPLVPTRDS
jgi:hypothetical protein